MQTTETVRRLAGVMVMQLELEDLPARGERLSAGGILGVLMVDRPVQCSRSRRSASWMTNMGIKVVGDPVAMLASSWDSRRTEWAVGGCG